MTSDITPPVRRRFWPRHTTTSTPATSEGAEPKYETCWSRAGAWDLCITIGKISLALVLAVSIIYVYDAGLIRKLNPLRLLPQAVAGLFSPDRPIINKTELDNIKAGTERALDQVAPHRKSVGQRELFTVGSDEARVRRVQGSPTSITGSTWNYGDSKVYFVNGRVVSWTTSAANPLRTR